MPAYQYVYVMNHLTKTYPGGNEVLKDVTLAFLPGAKIGVLGYNGAGKSTNIAIITTSGGSAVLMADECDRHGLKLPRLAAETIAAIVARAPQHCSLANPIDLTAQITGRNESFNAIVELALNDPNVDQLIVRYGMVHGVAGEAWARSLSEITAKAGKPLLVSLGRVPDSAFPALRVFERNAIPWALTPTRTALAAGALHQYADKQRRYRAAQSRLGQRVIARQQLELPADTPRLSEHDSKRCLGVYGIPVARELVLSLDSAAVIGPAPLNFPLAIKIDSPDIPHKTEAGAVRLGVSSLTAMKKAVRDILASVRKFRSDARIDGILVQEMAAGTEVIIGAVNDKYFGPVVMFGLGGVFTELLKDVTYRFAPFDVETAHEMIAEIKAAPLLTGYRGSAPLAIDALADVLSRVSLLAADHAGRIAEIDINPLFVGANGVVAADALIVLKN